MKKVKSAPKKEEKSLKTSEKIALKKAKVETKKKAT